MHHVRNRTDTATIVYRDKCDPLFDSGRWVIRDDEVLPLLNVLKNLPVAAETSAANVERAARHMLASEMAELLANPQVRNVCSDWWLGQMDALIQVVRRS